MNAPEGSLTYAEVGGGGESKGQERGQREGVVPAVLGKATCVYMFCV